MPVLVGEMGALFRKLGEGGVTPLLIKQNAEWVSKLADRGDYRSG